MLSLSFPFHFFSFPFFSFPFSLFSDPYTRSTRKSQPVKKFRYLCSAFSLLKLKLFKSVISPVFSFLTFFLLNFHFSVFYHRTISLATRGSTLQCGVVELGLNFELGWGDMEQIISLFCQSSVSILIFI